MTDKVSGAYNRVNRRFDTEIEIDLLKASTTTNDFVVIDTLIDALFFEYSNYHQNVTVRIARLDADLASILADATHIRVEGNIFVIRREDTVEPQGGRDFEWVIFGDRFAERSHYGPLY